MVLFVFFWVACKSDKPQDKQILPDKNDINQIVKVVVKKEGIINGNALLVAELHRIQVLTPGYPDSIPRPVGSLELKRLLNIKVNHKNFFAETDSLHLLFQNQLFKTFPIEKTLSKQIKFVSSAEVWKNMRSEITISFYDMTIPVFSSDNKKAYVEWDYNCATCGTGTALFLEKVRGKWIIVYEENLWVS